MGNVVESKPMATRAVRLWTGNNMGYVAINFGFGRGLNPWAQTFGR